MGPHPIYNSIQLGLFYTSRRILKTIFDTVDAYPSEYNTYNLTAPFQFDSMKVVIVIPARYKSSRLPGKPLADLCGKPMVQHVYERALLAKNAHKVIVATDDLRIFTAVKKFGGNVLMTSPEHQTGTDRVIEVSKRINADIFINVQGDEPLIRPEDIDSLIDQMLSNRSCQVATLCHPVQKEDALDPNVVKIVRSMDGKALYFSRHLIPFAREDNHQAIYLKHVGIYGYTAELLKKYDKLPFSQLENMEKLEQLRLIEAGIAINAIEIDSMAQGVDTPEDLARVRQYMTRFMNENHAPQRAISI